MNKTAFAIALSTSLIASNAYAASKTLTHTDRGAFNSKNVVALQGATWKLTRLERDAQGNPTGNKIESDNYQVRHLGTGDNQQLPAPFRNKNFPATRSYFTFDISGLTAPVTSVKLKVYHPEFIQSTVDSSRTIEGSYQSPDATETVEFFKVDTDAATLDEPDQANSPISKLDGIFNDLGSGDSYGSFVASEASEGTYEVIELSQAGIDALNAALNAQQTKWSIGAAMTTGSRTDAAVERVFRGTGSPGDISDLPATPATELIVEDASAPAPAPALTGLGGIALITGLGGIGMAFRRRRD